METVTILYFCDDEAYIPMQELFLAEELEDLGILPRVKPVLAGEDIKQVASEVNSDLSKKAVFWMERPYVTARHYNRCISLASLISKRKYFGGIFATMMPEEIWEEDPVFDVVFSGFNMEQIGKCIGRNDGRRGVLEVRGTIDINKYDLKLESLTDKHKFSRKKAYGYYTSVSCPNNCYYCFNNCLKSFGLQYSHRAEEKVYSDLSKIKKCFGCQSVTLKDFNFFCNPNAMRILGYAKELGLTISGNLDITLDDISQTTIRKLSEEFEVRNLFFGLESFSQDTLNELNKQSRIQRIYDIVNWVDQYNIRIHGIIMFGFPWETSESVKADIKRAFSLMQKANNLYIRFAPYMPLPGTVLQQRYFRNCYSSWNHRRKIKVFDTSKYNRRRFPFVREIQALDPYYLSLCFRNYLRIRSVLTRPYVNPLAKLLGRHVLKFYESELTKVRYGLALRLANVLCGVFERWYCYLHGVARGWIDYRS